MIFIDILSGLHFYLAFENIESLIFFIWSWKTDHGAFEYIFNLAKQLALMFHTSAAVAEAVKFSRL